MLVHGWRTGRLLVPVPTTALLMALAIAQAQLSNQSLTCVNGPTCTSLPYVDAL